MGFLCLVFFEQFLMFFFPISEISDVFRVPLFVPGPFSRTTDLNETFRVKRRGSEAREARPRKGVLTMTKSHGCRMVTKFRVGRF